MAVAVLLVLAVSLVLLGFACGLACGKRKALKNIAEKDKGEGGE